MNLCTKRLTHLILSLLSQQVDGQQAVPDDVFQNLLWLFVRQGLIVPQSSLQLPELPVDVTELTLDPQKEEGSTVVSSLGLESIQGLRENHVLDDHHMITIHFLYTIFTTHVLYTNFLLVLPTGYLPVVV